MFDTKETVEKWVCREVKREMSKPKMPLQDHTVVPSVVASVVLERDVDLMRIVFGAVAAILYQMISASKNWGIGIVKSCR